ncbi:MAG: hypothetical protein M9916_07475 [Crocinitomicaceae bacterium]|nr:hypothetical protein [Crocinitomicaceae bacterium]
MGCTNCGGGESSSHGCEGNGSCNSSGNNKFEVFDWLGNISLPANQTPYEIFEIRFKNSRKGFYRNNKGLTLNVGNVVVVEVGPGYDVGVVSAAGELARIQVSKKEPNFKELEAKKILRFATQEDIDLWSKGRALEKEVMISSRTLAVNLGLEMKISDVEYQGDLTKATFYYTADGRVDFRQLIKDMAEKFKIRIEMRQIGARQEAARLGGISSCGRELCSSTWLTDFRTVSTSAARYQQLSLNPQKLAGQCGKLKCCLNYELDMYVEALKDFPKPETKLHTEKGIAVHIKTDVFKRQMWYAYTGEAGIGSGLIALSPERVKEVISLNKNGQKPKDIESFVDYDEVEEKVVDYTNVVGQDSLNRFESAFKSKKKKKKKKPFNANGTAATPKVAAPQANQNPQNQQKKNPNFNKKRNPQRNNRQNNDSSKENNQ